MPRHAPVLECSAEDKATLIAITMSRAEEARLVERARIILSRLDGKEIQQVARELRVSIPTVTKWSKRFALGVRELGRRTATGQLPVTYDAAFRNRVLALLEQPPPPGMSHWDVLTRGSRDARQAIAFLAASPPFGSLPGGIYCGRQGHPPATTPQLVCKHG